MNRAALTILLTLSSAGTAVAQTADPHASHTAPAAPTQAEAAAAKPAAPAAEDPHAGHTMPTTPAQVGRPAAKSATPAAGDPNAGHTMPKAPAEKAAAPAADSPPGHTMPMPAPGQPAASSGMDPHAGHVMPEAPAALSERPALQIPQLPPLPPPQEYAADRVFDRNTMDAARQQIRKEHGGETASMFILDQAEYRAGSGISGYAWDGEFWYGGDINRVWLKSAGEGAGTEGLEKAEVQALYSRAIGPYFNLQAGLRYDVRPKPSRTYATVGVEGLAPRWFEVEGALFLSNKGELTARGEVYYDLRITQRLILQPNVEVNLAAQNSREIGIGSGLSDVDLGLRLRYEIRREFAPYVGISFTRKIGNTADFARSAGESVGETSFVVGIRTWF